MPLYFLDTSALQFRYLKEPRGRSIKKLVSDRRWQTYIAELTAVEISSAAGLHCRRNNLSTKAFDAMQTAFYRDLGEGRISVISSTQSDLLRARHLLRFAGVVRRRRISSADAIIASTCLELALEKQQRVVFYMDDRPLHSVLMELSAYRRALRLRLVAGAT